MLYIKSIKDEAVEILNTDNNEIITTDLDNYNRVASELCKQQNECGVVGAYKDGIVVPNKACITALSYIDYANGVPYIEESEKEHYAIKDDIFKYFDFLNYEMHSSFISLGDIALKCLNSTVPSTNYFYIKEDYLYVLLDCAKFFRTYIRFKITNKAKLSLLSIKASVLYR